MKKKMPVLAREVVVMYQRHMGHVDRVDKQVSLSRIRLKRCMKRYHRAFLLWYMAIVLNNIIVLFDLLFSDIETLRKSKARIGYKHWLQNELGNALIEYAIRVAKELIAKQFYENNSVDSAEPATTTPCTPATASTPTPVLRDQTNTTGGDSGRRRRGRPRKKKHAGGRPSTKKVHAYTHMYH